MGGLISKKRLSRRAMLRGTGVALALPWLDAMTSAWASPADAATAQAATVAVASAIR